MSTEQLIEACDTVFSRLEAQRGYATHTLATEFLRRYAGAESEFYHAAKEVGRFADPHTEIKRIVKEFRLYVQSGLVGGINPIEQARIDTVSDILGQAALVLEEKKNHAATATMLIGACLECFLRMWCEREKLIATGAGLTIDGYAKSLLGQNLITKQDMKDITAWAGNRNNAAHGHFQQVENREQIRIMLEGVNLFMRKYT